MPADQYNDDDGADFKAPNADIHDHYDNDVEFNGSINDRA